MNISYLSLLAQENLTNNRNKLGDSLNKLSSGLKINKASDDASGLSISDKLRTQASGIKQAISNANSAIAFAQIGDKAMAEQSNILDFTKQKLIQAATMTTSDEGRQMILSDIQKSLIQYDQIASTTNYDGITILQKSTDDQGESPEHTFQVGDSAGDTVSIEVVQANTSYGSGTQIDTLTISGEIKEKDIFTVVINDIPVSYVATASDEGTTSDKHNQVALGLKNEIESNSQLSNLISVENSSNGVLKFTSIVDGETFNVNPGTVTLDTNINLSYSNYDYPVAQEMTYEFTGTIESGDTYTVGGVSYTVQDSDSSMDDIIDKIVQGLNGTDGRLITGLNVISTLSNATASKNSSGNLVLTANVAGTPFTPPSYSTTNMPSVDDQNIAVSLVQANIEYDPGTPTQNQEKLYIFDETNSNVAEGDKYIIEIDHNELTYTVPSTDNSLVDVLNGIKDMLEANYLTGNMIITIEDGNKLRISTDHFVNLSQITEKSVYRYNMLFDGENWSRGTVIQDNVNGSEETIPYGIRTTSFNPDYSDGDQFKEGDIITYNYNDTISITYTVTNQDEESGDDATYEKLKNLINNDTRLSGKVIAFYDRTSTGIYPYDMRRDYFSIVSLSLDSVSDMNPPNDVLITKERDGVEQNFMYLSSGTTTYTEAKPEITKFALDIKKINPGDKISFNFNIPESTYSSDDSMKYYNNSQYTYEIKSTDTTIEDIINNINSELDYITTYLPSTTPEFNNDLTIANRTAISARSISYDSLTKELILTTYVPQNINTIAHLGSTATYESYADAYMNDYDTSYYPQYSIQSEPTYAELNQYIDMLNGVTEEYESVENRISISNDDTRAYDSTMTLIQSYKAGIPETPAQQQQVKYTLGGTVEEGDTYRIGDITYTVQSGDTTIENIVDKLIIGINGGTATGLSGTQTLTGVTATKDTDGTILLTADVAGTPFDIPSYEALNVGTNDQNIQLINTIENVEEGNENRYDISGFINEGNVYNIGGAIYTAQSGDTKEDIIDGLVKAINGDSATGVSGTPISGVTAAKTSSPIFVSIKPAINYTLSSSVNLSNLTSNEIKQDLSIDSSNVITLSSLSGKYVTYSEDSTIDYSNETQNIDTQNLQRVNSLKALKELDYLSIDLAKRFMSIVDENLTAINEFRGRFGSAQNQLESVTKNLMTSYVNVKSAESVIRDVDYASESANFNKLNILNQAGSFALSKSVERNEDILNLLK